MPHTCRASRSKELFNIAKENEFALPHPIVQYASLEFVFLLYSIIFIYILRLLFICFFCFKCLTPILAGDDFAQCSRFEIDQ